MPIYNNQTPQRPHWAWLVIVYSIRSSYYCDLKYSWTGVMAHLQGCGCHNLFSTEWVTFTTHYNYVIMGAMASKSPASRLFTQPFIQGADQRKHQSSASLAFVRGIHRSPVNSPHKSPVTRKMFPFDDVIMESTLWMYMSTYCFPFVITEFNYLFISQCSPQVLLLLPRDNNPLSEGSLSQRAIISVINVKYILKIYL